MKRLISVLLIIVFLFTLAAPIISSAADDFIMVTCMSCHGDGRFLCRSCNGSGETITWTSHGPWYALCGGGCGGAGTVQCNNCGGLGEVAVANVSSQNQQTGATYPGTSIRSFTGFTGAAQTESTSIFSSFNIPIGMQYTYGGASWDQFQSYCDYLLTLGLTEQRNQNVVTYSSGSTAIAQVSFSKSAGNTFSRVTVSVYSGAATHFPDGSAQAESDPEPPPPVVYSFYPDTNIRTFTCFTENDIRPTSTPNELYPNHTYRGDPSLPSTEYRVRRSGGNLWRDVDLYIFYLKYANGVTVTEESETGVDERGVDFEYIWYEVRKDSELIMTMKFVWSSRRTFSYFFLTVHDAAKIPPEPEVIPEPEPGPEPEVEPTKIEIVIDNTTARVNGENVTLDQPAVILSDRTMTPARFVAESLGAEVEWDGLTRKVTITKDDIIIEIVIDNTIARINGEEVTLDQPAVILNDRTMTPARFVAEALGAEVEWDGLVRKVTITGTASASSAASATPTRPATAAAMYAEAPRFPDFGAMFGLEMITMYNLGPSGERLHEYGYWYPRDEVTDDMVNEYINKLIELGFEYHWSTGPLSIYTNDKLRVDIFYGDNDFTIAVSEYSSTVDFFS